MKIKVLQIIPQFVRGGAETVALNYARFLDKEKFEVVTASCVEGGEIENEFKKNNTRIWVGSRKKMGGRLAVWFKLNKFVKEFQPDIIHTHLFGADLVGFILKFICRNKRVKLIATIHNVEKYSSLVRRLLWRFMLPKFDKIIAVASPVAEYAFLNLQAPKENLVTLLNGISLENWLRVKSIATSRDGIIRLAVVGRLVQQKGHIFLLRALSKLSPSLKFECYFFGDGNEKNYLERAAKCLNLTEKVFFRGVTDNLANELNYIDIIVQPSVYEGLSLAVMELMAAGKAIVASEAAGAGLIDDNITGLIVPVGGVAELASAIAMLASNSALRERLGVAAREHARQNFGVEKNVAAVEKIYVATTNFNTVISSEARADEKSF